MTLAGATVDRPLFTPTQQRIVDVLQDGQPHHRNELFQCLNDDLTTYTTLKVHLCNIRKVLRPLGQDVICELSGQQVYYRLARLLASPYDGRR